MFIATELDPAIDLRQVEGGFPELSAARICRARDVCLVQLSLAREGDARRQEVLAYC